MPGTTIKKLRRERGYSISELAERAGVSKSYLSYIERDVQKNPSLQFLKKISDTLNVDVNHLLTEEVKTSAEELDNEWVSLLSGAIEKGLTKEEFKEYCAFLEFKHWQAKKE
ncbi:helix-turn-helix domain-containing protein [Bacillus lacus]|uniref:Helix-turn-helix domain-containing protein n=1 Tax=Metabacillus lacus TaxID=1983721 RepID=A0A7X2LZ82_9BACI|nr:helix-turn-helix domain-containing protein [Metabacillus lacus]MRX72608.1 helix-turn-helix domain-containing protein [Metabacillus lacus]